MDLLSVYETSEAAKGYNTNVFWMTLNKKPRAMYFTQTTKIVIIMMMMMMTVAATLVNNTMITTITVQTATIPIKAY